MEDPSPLHIDIPLPRIRARVSTIPNRKSRMKQTVQHVFKKSREYSQDSLEKYKPQQKRPLRFDLIRKEEIQLPYVRYAKEQERRARKEENNISLKEAYKVSLSNYRNRFQVEDSPNDVKAITDIEKEFFDYVNGRSISDRVPLYKTLKTSVNNIAKLKLEIGFRRERMLNMDINYRNEMKVYEKSLKQYKEQTKNLNAFILDDYKTSLALLKECDALHNKVLEKSAELQLFADQKFRTVSSLLSLDYMYYIQQMYGRFLYYLSPPSWRSHNRNFAQSIEIELKGFDLGKGGDDKSFDDVFEKMQKECVNDLVSPALYFTQPHQLMQIFEIITHQQSNFLDDINFLNLIIKHTKDGIKLLKDITKQEIYSLISTIKNMETKLKDNEEKGTFLKEKFFKIVNGLFYDSTSSPEVIKLSLHIEFVYEEVFSEKPYNLDIVSMLKSLDSYYNIYCKHFDLMLNIDIKEVVKQHIEMERQKLRRARQARRELYDFDRMKKRMIRAFQPSLQKQLNVKENISKVNKVKLPVLNVNKSVKFRQQKPIPDLKTVSLNETQLEYLKLFTDWSHDDDPFNYLHSE